MAHLPKTGSIVGAVAFVATCAAGFVVTSYAVTAAYLMGANAQSELDESQPAPPEVLLRKSLQAVLQKANIARAGSINIDDKKVEVNTVPEDCIVCEAEVVESTDVV